MKVECCVCLTDLPDQCKTAFYTPGILVITQVQGKAKSQGGRVLIINISYKCTVL